MPVLSIKDMLQHACDNGYIVASFEVNSLDIAQAVITVAERNHAPVILSLNEQKFDRRSLKIFLAAIETAACESVAPVAIEYYRARHLDKIIHAINSGCNAVMLDTQHESLRNSTAHIRQIVNMAHDCGIVVEGHLVQGMDIKDVKRYVAKTDIDSLRISPYGIHGWGTDASLLDYASIDKLNKALHIPLTINANTDIQENQYQRLIEHGIAKIDYSSAIYDIAASLTYNAIRSDKNSVHAMTKDIRNIFSNEVESCLCLGKSTGQAASLMKHYRSWRPVEHLIIYNVEGLTEDEVAAMTEKGRNILSRIPGVREVVTATAIKSDVKYRYSWLIRFCHPAVIDSYREHPLHIAFADELFRPVAGDRISIDYQWDVSANGRQAIDSQDTHLKPDLPAISC